MKRFIDDLRKTFEVKENKDNKNIIYISDVCFGVSQGQLDTIRKRAKYEKYVECVKSEIYSNSEW